MKIRVITDTKACLDGINTTPVKAGSVLDVRPAVGNWLLHLGHAVLANTPPPIPESVQDAPALEVQDVAVEKAGSVTVEAQAAPPIVPTRPRRTKRRPASRRATK